MSTPVADIIAAYGQAAAEGLITRREAIDYLSSNHGLTLLGAEDVLKSWETIHDRYASDTTNGA